MDEPEWRSQDTPGFREHKDGGSGAVGGGEALSTGAGDYGGGRGTDYQAPPPGEPEAEAEARKGPIPDVHMHEGWGGADENYAPAQGPNDRGEGEQNQDREFWDKAHGERSRGAEDA
jgi:hypothetical protein